MKDNNARKKHCNIGPEECHQKNDDISRALCFSNDPSLVDDRSRGKTGGEAMKKIINGKRYNTETAEALAKWNNGLGPRDFNHVYETLYRTPNGNYFLFGEGGPASRYARAVGQNSWSGSSEIIPLTPNEAAAWCERTDSVETLEEYFSDTFEDA